MAKTKCSICNKKIGFFRKMFTKGLDKDPMHMVPLSQFCSNKCAKIGLDAVMKQISQ